MTYPPPLEQDTPRYTTVAAVKKQMQINDSVWDTEITTAITAAENLVDVICGRSFDEPVPPSVSQAALLASMKMFKLGDMPGGIAGADAEGFLGVFTLDTQAREARYVIREILFGKKVSWGIAGVVSDG